MHPAHASTRACAPTHICHRVPLPAGRLSAGTHPKPLPQTPPIQQNPIRSTPHFIPSAFLRGFSRFSRTPTEFRYQPGDWLVFGAETSGLPPQAHADVEASGGSLVKVPIRDSHVRSINLAVAAGVGLFEAIRQLDEGRDLQSIICNLHFKRKEGWPFGWRQSLGPKWGGGRGAARGHSPAGRGWGGMGGGGGTRKTRETV